MQTASAMRKELWWDSSTVIPILNIREAAEVVGYKVREIQQQVKAELHMTTLVIGGYEVSWRKQLWPEYKIHRDLCKVPFGLNTLREQVIAEAVDYGIVTARGGLEADDVLGKMATDPDAESTFIVWSPDKDLKQIPGLHLIEGELVEISRAEGDRFHLFQTLTGDSADGYPGLKGVGPVKANKLLDEAATWENVLTAFTTAKYTEQEALIQASVARILRWKEQPGLWNPNSEE